MSRRVLLVSHAVRTDVQHLSVFLAARLQAQGIEAVVPAAISAPVPEAGAAGAGAGAAGRAAARVR